MNMIDNDCCCQTAVSGIEAVLTCEDKKRIFTRREEAVLGKIREMSDRARNLKHKIGALEGEARLEALNELETLRALRFELETERIAASEERMRLLGHI